MKNEQLAEASCQTTKVPLLPQKFFPNQHGSMI